MMKINFSKIGIVFLLFMISMLLPTHEAKAWKLFGKDYGAGQAVINNRGCFGTVRPYTQYFLGIPIRRDVETSFPDCPEEQEEA